MSTGGVSMGTGYGGEADAASLAEVLAREGTLAPARASKIIYQLAGQLDEARLSGRAYGGVEPRSILIDSAPGRADTAYVPDYLLRDAAEMTPEQRAHKAQRALAALAVQMLTGARLDPSQPAWDQLISHGLPPATVGVLIAALAERADGFATFAEFAEALARSLGVPLGYQPASGQPGIRAACIRTVGIRAASTWPARVRPGAGRLGGAGGRGTGAVGGRPGDPGGGQAGAAASRDAQQSSADAGDYGGGRHRLAHCRGGHPDRAGRGPCRSPALARRRRACVARLAGCPRAKRAAPGYARHAVPGHGGDLLQRGRASTDGSELLAVDTGGNVREWNLHTGAATALPGLVTADPTGAFTISPGLAAVATTEGGGLVAVQAPFGRYLGDFPANVARLSPPEPLLFSPDGRVLAIGDDSGNVRLLNLTTRRSVILPNPDTDKLEGDALAFSPDGRTLAVGYQSGHVGLWDTASSRLTATLAGPDPDTSATAVAFSADGGLLATGDSQGNVYLWNVARRSIAGAPSGTTPGQTITSQVAFSPDGGLLAGKFDDGKIGLWSVATGRRLAVLDEHDQVTPGPFALGEQFLASINGDGVVSEWSLGRS